MWCCRLIFNSSLSSLAQSWCMQLDPALHQIYWILFSGSISQNGGMPPCSKYRMYLGDCISASRAGGTGRRTWWSRKRAEEALRRLLYRGGGWEKQTLWRTGRTMCWEMINPPQRPLLRSGGTSSMIFGSHELLLLRSQLPSCNQMCLSTISSHYCARHHIPPPVSFTPFLAALWQYTPSYMCILRLSRVPPPPVSVSQVSGSTQSMLGEGSGSQV